MPVAYVSQTDAGRTFEAVLFDEKEYSPPDGATVSIHLRKSDNSTKTVACTYSGSVVTVKLSATETDISGDMFAKLWIEKDALKIGTQGIVIRVDEEV